tara:strand:+ start:93 stop:479 length:387 start_codon:yes stop_codon:yes gene_type:complete
MSDDATPFFDLFAAALGAAAATAPESQATELAIRRVDAANSPAPLDRAEADGIAKLAGLPILVSSDSIFPSLDEYGFSDNRAVGPLMRRLVVAGKIRPTGDYRKSRRPGSHGAPRAVYRNALALLVWE